MLVTFALSRMYSHLCGSCAKLGRPESCGHKRLRCMRQRVAQGVPQVQTWLAACSRTCMASSCLPADSEEALARKSTCGRTRGTQGRRGARKPRTEHMVPASVQDTPLVASCLEFHTFLPNIKHSCCCCCCRTPRDLTRVAHTVVGWGCRKCSCLPTPKRPWQGSAPAATARYTPGGCVTQRYTRASNIPFGEMDRKAHRA